MSIFIKERMLKFGEKNLRILIFFFLFYIISWHFFTFRITDVPPGINGDEAAIGYNAILVARTGHDQSNRFLPLFVSAFDLTDWKQPITFYSTVLAFKIFGVSYSMLREVSVIIILISATLMFFLCKEIFGKMGGVLSIFVFLTIPAVLIQSHLALENIAPIPFTILWFWMLAKYKKSFKHKYLYLSALSLGLGLFSYPGMRLIVPVFLSLSLVYIFYLNRDKGFKKRFSEVLKFFVIVIIFPIFLYSIKNQYPGAILAYNRPHGVVTYQDILLPFISSFDPSFLFIQGDSTPYHSTGRQGVFLLATLPLFVFGIWKIAQKRDSFLIFTLFAFFLTPLLYGLASSIHRGSRLLVLLPTFTIITSLGFLELMKIKGKAKKILLFLTIGLVLINYIDFARDYFFDYPKRVKSEFGKPYQLVFKEASFISKTQNLAPYIQEGFRNHNKIAVDFFELAYFPNNLNLWKGDLLAPNSVTIAGDNPIKRDKIEQTIIGEFSIIVNQSNESK